MNPFAKFWQRVRYPAALPQEIADDLGVALPERFSFDDFLTTLARPISPPSRLRRFMPRSLAEAPFNKAQLKERFKENTLFSYYFNEGWIIFILSFDSQGRLRGIQIRHERLKQEEGVILPLNS